jgi:hypothetical protein
MPVRALRTSRPPGRSANSSFTLVLPGSGSFTASSRGTLGAGPSSAVTATCAGPGAATKPPK